MLATPTESAVKLPPHAWLPLVATAECVPEEPPILFLSAAQARPGNRQVLASRPLLDALILVVPNWVCNISVKTAIIWSHKILYII
jgi:hypothetical protein